jgi:hypothetical protein
MHSSLTLGLWPHLSDVIPIKACHSLSALWSQSYESPIYFIGDGISSLGSCRCPLTENQLVTFIYSWFNQRENNCIVASPRKYQAGYLAKKLILSGSLTNIHSPTREDFNRQHSFISARSFILQPC